LQQAFNRDVIIVEGVLSEMPILAIKAMKCAGMGKNREVIVAVFSLFAVGIHWISTLATARTDPVPYAVGGQRIVVP
jgi:hypothetical protein